MPVLPASLAVPPMLLEQETRELASSPAAPWLPGVLLIALLLAAAHLAAPRLRVWLSPRSTAFGSFGGGLAAAYVFLHLIPELERGHALLGALIFLVPLVGFLVYYVLDRRFRAARRAGRGDSPWSFAQRLANLAVYNALFVYGLPQLGFEVGPLGLPVAVAILVHLIHSDYGFGEDFPERVDSIGRYVLAAAALLGYAAIVLERRTDEALNDLLTAFLAGSVLYNVFREEIPDDRRSHLGWFTAGIAAFAAAALLTLE